MENGGFFFALCLLLEGRLCSLELQKKNPSVSPLLIYLFIYLYLTALNPSPLNKPELDPEDQFLVSDTYAPPGQLANGSAAGHGSASTSTPGPGTNHVPWLRKTEYISREGIHRTQALQDA